MESVLTSASSTEISENNSENETSSVSEQSSSSTLLASKMLKTRSGRCVKTNSAYSEIYAKKKQRQNLINIVKKALKKCPSERTKDDADLLINCEDLVKHVDVCKQNRLTAAAHQEIIIDERSDLETKCEELSDAIRNSKNCVVYTGAGISTSASIPDYRGPNGLWTLLDKGIKVELPDFAHVEPTYSHMALCSLMKHGIVKHIVSQNCDGLHLRSGIDRNKLSELHGNCFIEFCVNCSQEYVRLFDVTERSAFRKHSTGRYCNNCAQESDSKVEDDSESSPKHQLRDSIIHFGEKLRNGSPYNWETARDNVKNADLIICLGTSLKVLKHYACLWSKKKTCLLYIVNIQWTPKDKQAQLKIHGYCDDVLKLIIQNLQPYYKSLKVNKYSLKTDPIFNLAVKLTPDEINTTSKQVISLKRSSVKQEPRSDKDSNEENASNNKNLNSWYNKSFKTRKTKPIDSK